MTRVFSIIFSTKEMKRDIFEAMVSLGKEKVESVLGSRQMAVHAVHHNAGSVVGMGALSPCHNGRLDFMAGCAEMWRRSPDHGVITEAEKGKSDEYTKGHKGRSNNDFFHFTLYKSITMLGEWIKSIVNRRISIVKWLPNCI